MPKISEETREKRKKVVLDSALELFSKRGYFSTSIEDLVKHAGISKGYIYTYFNSKEDIFIELANNLQNKTERNEKILKEINKKNIPLSSKLVKLWDEIVKQWTSENLVFARLQYEFFLESSKSERLKQIMIERSEESLKLVKEVIYDNKPNADRNMAEAFARLWWAKVDGLVAYFISHEKLPEDSEMENIRELIKYMSEYFDEK